MRIVILGLSITSSWGNGHATTYRSLVRELARRGHDVLFLERDLPWYAENRDLPQPPYCRTALYESLSDLDRRFRGEVRAADLTIVGSYVPDGIAVGEWAIENAGGLTAFYDIDTPVTISRLESGDCEYLAPHLIPQYDVYLSFTGGPLLESMQTRYGSPMARVLYCSVDPELYYPERLPKRWDLGYLGTYSDDRQPLLECLMLEPARRMPDSTFIVAGPLYPEAIAWPKNIERIDHLAPDQHRAFYNAQRFTLNITRAEMKAAGFSPSVRLFEAAACGAAIVSDAWRGLDTLFEPGKEILVANGPDEVLEILRNVSREEAAEIGARARRRVLAGHTAAHRAMELEQACAAAVQNNTTA